MESKVEKENFIEISKKAVKSTCEHKLMKVTILPHPPNFDEARLIDFCFYEKINGSFKFYSGNQPTKAILEIDDESSIKW
ncbi:hypothetical protein EHQ24_15725 [Leptospira noumeaensis]|uniref:Uncharacterized protein n=1 Tax=Leptospira noumeaensis TaxID=2484964 RepID=A0A4R9I1C5_9LEPT|nr:hypothetical protein [Leptospira noumeaensis]TGK78996.1 hypothetical protein EHQ24_15725 [Leptospira noumeaensis]